MGCGCGGSTPKAPVQRRPLGQAKPPAGGLVGGNPMQEPGYTWNGPPGKRDVPAGK